MTPFNTLTSIDKDKFMFWTGDNLHASPEGQRADVETILAEWNRSKQTLFNMFGDQLILSKQVEITKQIDELECNIESALYNNKFRQDWMIWVNSTFDNETQWSLKWNLHRLGQNWHVLATNRWDGDTFQVPLKDEGKFITVQANSKVIKTIGKILQKYPEITEQETWTEFVNTHSLVLNNKKVTGNLCLSIHPLDYATASDNDSCWDSCMNWRDDGDYHGGTIEMMNSPYVVCAYLESETPMNLGNGMLWNNKKWRQFFIVHNDFIAAIKGYPVWNRELEAIVLAWLKELAEKVGYSYLPTLYKWNTDKALTIDDDHDVCLGFTTAGHAMYNDFYSGNDYYAYIHNADIDNYNRRPFNYCGAWNCMWCGQIANFDGENAVTCYDCYEHESESYCAECGYHTDDLIEVDGEWICQDCYDNLSCDMVTGECHFDDCMRKVNLASRDKNELYPEFWFYLYESSYSLEKLCAPIYTEVATQDDPQYKIYDYHTVLYIEDIPDDWPFFDQFDWRIHSTSELLANIEDFYQREANASHIYYVSRARKLQIVNTGKKVDPLTF